MISCGRWRAGRRAGAPLAAPVPVTRVPRDVILTPLAPWGFCLLPDPREVPAEPAWFFCFLLTSLSALCSGFLAHPPQAERGGGGGGSPLPGGCLFSAAWPILWRKNGLFRAMGTVGLCGMSGRTRFPSGAARAWTRHRHFHGILKIFTMQMNPKTR